MNAEKLKATIEALLGDEESIRIQEHLVSFNEVLRDYVNAPGQPDSQLKVATYLNELRRMLAIMTGGYDPAAEKRIAEIQGTIYFTDELIQLIQEAMSENQMTPMVVSQMVSTLVEDRENYIRKLRSIAEGFDALGIKSDYLDEGESEIGFQLPRDLFGNELRGLIAELSAIRRIIRAFAEVATGSAEPIKIRQISTSDPTFFFLLSLPTIGLLGTAITWALNTWKQVEDIKKVRAETSKLKSFTSEETAAIFDTKINQTIELAIEEKIKLLLPGSEGEAGRIYEQKTDLRWALEAILARVERGMTVEIKFLPPVTPQAEMASAVETLKNVVPQLTFPPPEPNPVLSLPKAEDDRS